MGQVINMDEARKRLRPEEEECDLLFLDEVIMVDDDLAEAIAALLMQMQHWEQLKKEVDKPIQ